MNFTNPTWRPAAILNFKIVYFLPSIGGRIDLFLLFNFINYIWLLFGVELYESFK